MSEIIDLTAFEPEPLSIKMKSGMVYNIPASISVQLMTKIMNLQKKAKEVKDPTETFTVLFNMAFEILSLDKSKTVTMDTVRAEFDDLIILRKFINIFDDFMGKSVESVIPQDEIPNSKTPLEKK
ncbi:MAG: hypothetical protein LKJ17_00075 [Oscillospiraceae bacterium]|jgi:hypothetical protein|nr:hypothetical protein [Oscillospiraceae bacterium]